MNEFIELTTTTATEQEAQRLARLLVEQRLASCVQVTGPVHSVYRWQGEICQATEFQCNVKSLATLTDRLVQAVRQAHSYDTPQIVVLPVVDCDADYAQWWRAQLESSDEAR